MPSANINDVLASKPLTFTVKTGGGSWKCQLHSNRAAYEKTRATAAPTTAVAPGISRSDSGLSTSSSSSAGSSSSH